MANITNLCGSTVRFWARQGSGSRRRYGPDALGSVVATYSAATGALENTYRNKPFGGQLAKTGTATDPSFRWAGTLGCRQTGMSWSDVHMRARHYSTSVGRWTTRDPLWPEEPDYPYVSDAPTYLVDPFGLQGLTQQELFNQWQRDVTSSAANLANNSLNQASQQMNSCTQQIGQGVDWLSGELPYTYAFHQFAHGLPLWGHFCGPQTIDGEKLGDGRPVGGPGGPDACCQKHDHCFATHHCTVTNQFNPACSNCTRALCKCLPSSNCHNNIACNYWRQFFEKFYCRKPFL